MNIFSVPRHGGAATVIIDNAHNEASLEALMEVMSGLRPAGGRLLIGLGAVGDRTDDLIEALGEIGARASDIVAIGHKTKYLRGRTPEGLEELLRAGAARVGVADVPAYLSEVDCLAALVGQTLPADVVGLMCHAEQDEVFAWLDEQGATVDSPEVLREKVRAARG
jgi:cyanophycin synthetase